MRKVVILGKCSNSRSDAPLNNPSWEIWTLAWDPTPVCHRTFEMHTNWRDFHGDVDDAKMHRDWLAGHKCPVYMWEKVPEVPQSVRYPFEEVSAIVGKTWAGIPYLESSIAYMMGVAMLEMWHDPGRIGLWGIDMSVSTEYAYQKANMEYLIGLARGRGISVYTPPQSALLTNAMPKPYGTWTAQEMAAETAAKAAAKIPLAA